MAARDCTCWIGSLCFALTAMAAGAFAQAPPATPGPSPDAAIAASRPVVREKRDGPVTLRVEADRDRMDLMSAALLTVTVEAESGVEVTLPEIHGVLGEFVARPEGEAQRSEDGGLSRTIQTFVLEPVRPGAATTGAIGVEYVDARPRADGTAGETRGTVEIEPIVVTVVGDLADARGPVGLPWAGLAPIWWWVIGLVAGTVAVALAARWWAGRGRVAQPTAARRAVVAPAHVWALAELERLLAEGLVARGKVQEFYYRINALVRGYIERRFGLMAGEQTSEEFIASLRGSPQLADGHKAMLRRFVDACDPVKYARQIPGEDEINWVAASARRFIEETADRGEGNGETGVLGDRADDRAVAGGSVDASVAAHEVVRPRPGDGGATGGGARNDGGAAK
jgi:hypothetical protein